MDVEVDVDVDVEVDVVVVSQSLQVLAHLFPKLPHKPCNKTAWHCTKDNTLRLFAQRSGVVVVDVDVEVV